MALHGHGLSLDLPLGWEARIWKAEEDPAAPGSSYPVVHAANFPLPVDRSHFGSTALQVMGGGDLFLAMVEYPPPDTRSAWFDKSGLVPPIRLRDFEAAYMRLTRPGQVGWQHWCSLGGRAFCLYVVAQLPARVFGMAELNAVAGSLVVGPTAGPQDSPTQSAAP